MNKYIKFQYSIIHILWIIQLVIQISSSSSINILHCLKGDVRPSSTFEKKIYINNFSETVLFLSKPVKAAVKGYTKAITMTFSKLRIQGKSKAF